MQPEQDIETDRGLGLAESLVADVAGLVSPPDICVKIGELIQDPKASTQAIGEIIIRDPNLTARLLKLVNSSFYGLRSKIDTVSRAITVVGTRDLYALVLAISAVKSFSHLPNKLVNMDTFWRHSLYTALIARILAKRVDVLHPERLFIAGLLHDIGSLVVYSRLHELARDILLTAKGDEEVFYHMEMEMLGFSHADLGSLLLAQWQMSPELQDAVACHHAPAKARTAVLESAILHISNVLANRSGLGGYCEMGECLSAIDERALEAIGLAAGSLAESELTGQAGLQFADTAALLAA